ncbi:MAG: hypothetical protein ACJA1Z_002491 [Patiriisocius sp.]|jgi:hypothetical protein
MVFLKNFIYCNLIFLLFLSCKNLQTDEDNIYTCKFSSSRVYIELEDNRATLYKQKPTRLTVSTKFVDRSSLEILAQDLYKVGSNGKEFTYEIDTDHSLKYVTITVNAQTTERGVFFCQLQIPFGDL